VRSFFNGLLSLFELLCISLISSAPRNGPLNPPKKILIFGYMGIGDFLLFTPTIRNLKKLYPDARLTLLTAPYSGAPSMAKGVNVLDEIKIIDWKNKSWKERRQINRALEAENYDLVVGTYIAPVRFFMWGLRNVPVRVGSCRKPSTCSLRFNLIEEELFRRHFFNRKVFLSGSGVHEIDHGLALLCQLTPSQTWEREVRIDDVQFGNAAAVENEMVVAGLPKAQSLIAFHPGVSLTQKWKQWPAERWAEMAKRLLAHWEVSLVVFATPAEWSELKGAFESAGLNPHNFFVHAPEDALRVRRFLSKCAVFADNDSGLGHLAVSTGTPNVHVFGPTDPVAFGPWINDTHTVITAGPACEPTVRLGLPTGHRSACGHKNCLNEISVELVYSAVSKKLSASGVRTKVAA
jgi:ADP-heptose:LPS heptosyltransferase